MDRIKFTEKDFAKANLTVSEDDYFNQFNDFKSQLELIDKKYQPTYVEPIIDLPPSLGLEKLTFDMPTDESFKTKALEMLNQKYLDSLTKIGNSSQSAKDKAYSKKDYLLEEVDSKNKLIDKALVSSKEQVDKNALNKGLSRSSILAEQQKKLVDQATSHKNDNFEFADKTSTDIDNEIAKLEKLKEQAVKDFDLSYAAEINAKILDLKSTELKKQDDVQKYNNSVDEKETKYQASRQEKILNAKNDEEERVNKLLEMRAKYGDYGMDKMILEEKLKSAKAFFDNMPAQEAFDLFTSDSSMNYHLKDYYNYLYEHLEGRL